MEGKTENNQYCAECLKVPESQYNDKGDAEYYRGERIEVIRVMEKVYGTRAVLSFCECNVLKYRLRMGKKAGQSLERELAKVKWYEMAAAYFFEQVEQGSELIGLDGISDREFGRHGLPWEER